MSNLRETDLPHLADRRQLLKLVAAGFGVSLVDLCSSTANAAAPKNPCGKAKSVKLDKPAEEIIAEAYRLGYDYQKNNGGCAQCSIAALQGAIPFVTEDNDLFRAASCLSGGATPNGVQNCGAFTGCGMVIGYMCGRGRGKDAFAEGDRKPAQLLIRKVCTKFEQNYGTVLCKDVKKASEGKCPEVVGNAAKWTAEALLEQFAGYKPPTEKKEPCKKPSTEKAPCKPCKKEA